MQKKDDIVIGETGVALRHFLAHENLDSRIKSVDLHIIFDNDCLLGKNRSTADEHSQQRDTGFFHIVPPIFSLISNPLLCGYSNRSLRSARFSMAEHCFALQRTGRRTAWDVRFGSKADISQCNRHVRFPPESGHARAVSRCQLWARTGHGAQRPSIRHSCRNASPALTSAPATTTSFTSQLCWRLPTAASSR